MKYEKFIAGSMNNTAQYLKEHLKSLDLTCSYAQMMVNRVNGDYSEQCNDVYFVAHDDNKMLARLWNGWGKHKNSIGNFGNFLTIEEARGNGIGGQLLKMWQEDISERDNLPLGLFCSAGSKELVNLYAKFGFVLAIRGAEVGPLYKPLNDSPKTFFEFCEEYYTPSNILYAQKASVEYRHEIDCLLKFALLDRNLKFGFDEAASIEETLVFKKDFSVNILFTEDNKVAGWQLILSDGTVKNQVFPLYYDTKIKNV